MFLTVTVVVEPDGDEFLAYCPAFKGLLMDGRTEEEALDRVRDGLLVYLESLERHGDPIPIGPDCQLAMKPIKQLAEPAQRAPARIPVPCPEFALA